MNDASPIVIVMPAFNEAKVIGSVLSRIPQKIDRWTTVTIVVDDGSTDATGEIARQMGAYVLRHMANVGVGAATTTGLKAAKRFSAEIVITMDADGQHDPADVPALVKRLMEGPFDVVIGARWRAGNWLPFT